MLGTNIARWTATRSGLASWAYTRDVASLPKRLTTLAIVIAVSGSPAVLSACMAFCLQGVAHAASHPDSQSAGHAADLVAAIPTSASAHAHHASPVSNESAATATAVSHDLSEARLSAPCTNCCLEAQGTMVAGLGVERVDAKAFSATPVASRMASFLVMLPGLGASPPSPPVPPPSPNRAPLALRI